MDQDSSGFYRETFSDYEVQLNTIPSLSKSIISVSGGTPTPAVMEFVQGLDELCYLGTKPEGNTKVRIRYPHQLSIRQDRPCTGQGIAHPFCYL